MPLNFFWTEVKRISFIQMTKKLKLQQQMKDASLSPADILKTTKTDIVTRQQDVLRNKERLCNIYVLKNPLVAKKSKKYHWSEYETMLLDNYTQFGNNGSNNIFSVDNDMGSMLP